MPQDILQHATKLYVCKSVKQKDQFGPIQGVLKMGTKVSLLEPKCMDLIFAIQPNDFKPSSFWDVFKKWRKRG